MCTFKPFSRRNAWIVYSFLLVFAVTTNLFLGGLVNLILTILFSVATLFAVVYFLCTKPSESVPSISPKPNEKEQAQAAASDLTQSLVSVNTEHLISTRMKPKRLYYLDNLKSILTAIVVAHHTTMAFSSEGGWYYHIANYYNAFQVPSLVIQVLDQSYFMCLFFFISGYFSPISCDRKGVRSFLRDKFKRLGIPFIVYQLILGPFVGSLVNYVFISDNKWVYGADAGPCWFLLWLLIFNVCYAMMDQKASYLQLSFPGTCKLILCGMIFGIIQFGVVLIIPEGSFIYMPITFGSFLFDILFFSCGVASYYNQWLVDGIPQLSRCNVIMIRILAILCLMGMTAVMVVLYVYDAGFLMPKKDASDHDCDSDSADDIDWKPWMFGAYGTGFMLSGVCTMVMSLAWIQFSYSYLNFSNKVTMFLSKSAYTVYIIHPLIVVPITWSFQKLLELFDDTHLYFCKDTSVSKTHFKSYWLIWVGWIYAVVLSLCILWPLAWYIRKLPGLRLIL